MPASNAHAIATIQPRRHAMMRSGIGAEDGSAAQQKREALRLLRGEQCMYETGPRATVTEEGIAETGTFFRKELELREQPSSRW